MVHLTSSYLLMVYSTYMTGSRGRGATLLERKKPDHISNELYPHNSSHSHEKKVDGGVMHVQVVVV